MRWSLPLALSVSVLLLPGISVQAQDSTPLRSVPVLLPPPPDTLAAADRTELDVWLAGMRKWQRMDKRWHNAAAHDPFGRIIQRAARPGAPGWLDARCAALGPGWVGT